MTSIAIEGTYNARQVGPDSTPWLVRAASLDGVTDAGSAALTGLGLALVVDLREDEERGFARHRVPIRHIPIYRSREGSPVTGTLEESYETMILTRGQELTAAVAAIADSPGPVLVHCTTGKDRTGLVVALALLAGGLPEEDIVDDYALSATDVGVARRSWAETALRALGLGDEEYAAALRLHLGSPSSAIRHALHILTRFGGAEAYLLRHGLTVDHFHALRDRFGVERVEPAD
jgi:hypothetical protein